MTRADAVLAVTWKYLAVRNGIQALSAVAASDAATARAHAHLAAHAARLLRGGGPMTAPRVEYSEQVPRLRLAFVSDLPRPDVEAARHPRQVARLAHTLFDADDPCEALWCIHLDARNRVIGCVRHSSGGFSASIAQPREILTAALLAGAVGVILSHNHPSGDTAPSREDVAITKRVAEAAELLGVRMLDHIIVGTGPAALDDYTSFQERGLL